MMSVLNKLTPRQREVFDLLAQGKSARQIATELHITWGTARTHTCNIYNALSVSSKNELTRIQMQERINELEKQLAFCREQLGKGYIVWRD